MDNFYLLKKEIFNDIYPQYEEQGDYVLDIIKNHGFGFYAINTLDISNPNPEWYNKAINGEILRLIIKHCDYITFESTGFKLCLELLKKRKLTLPDKVIEIPKELKIVLVVDKEWLYFYNKKYKSTTPLINLEEKDKNE